jgi:hypothetical protein
MPAAFDADDVREAPCGEALPVSVLADPVAAAVVRVEVDGVAHWAAFRVALPLALALDRVSSSQP